jgi:hypothetical protein
MFRRKWEAVYDNFCQTGMGAGEYLFWSRRSAESWVKTTQGFVGAGALPPLKIRWYVRERKLDG